MIDIILKKSAKDARLAGLLDEAREYAEIYLMAKHRQKGCDGMGETVTLKEEYLNALDKLIKYCIEHEYLTGDSNNYDPDIPAKKILRSKDERIP